MRNHNLINYYNLLKYLNEINKVLLTQNSRDLYIFFNLLQIFQHIKCQKRDNRSDSVMKWLIKDA